MMSDCFSIFLCGILVFTLNFTPARGTVCSRRISQYRVKYELRERSGGTNCPLLMRLSSQCGPYIHITYSIDHSYQYFCCTGWAGKDCTLAICAGKTNPHACSVSGWVKEGPSGPVHTSSGGTCSSPGVCTGCNNGFYSSGGYCTACRPIAECYYPKCTTSSNSICHYCKGVIKNDPNQYGWWAFTRWRDGGRSCQRACSWRTGSQCYPGNCPHTTAASCRCTSGFQGTDCRTMTENPVIVNSLIRLRSTSGTTFNSDSTKSRVWSNIANADSAYVQVDGTYAKQLPAKPAYISSAYVGIKTGEVILKLIRGGSYHRNHFSSRCTRSVPQSNYRCHGTYNTRLNKWWNFVHRDRLIVSASVTNGGSITVVDRENADKQTTHTMVGKTVTKSYEIQIDLAGPTHCTGTSSCMSSMLNVPDTTTKNVVTVRWQSWKDDDAGLQSYRVVMYSLSNSREQLVQGSKRYDKVHGTNVAQISLTFPSPGPYAILITVTDKVGNHRTARRIINYDNKSVVELQRTPDLNSTKDLCALTSTPIAVYITQADPKTSCQWITSAPTSVTVAWKQRFINRRHNTGKWLNAVAASSNVDKSYDDSNGDRQVGKINNVLGIVKFKVSYTVSYLGKNTSYPFTETPNVLSESATINVDMTDGKWLSIVVRGYDIVGAYADDVTSVKADNSPPLVTNHYLTRAGKTGLFVHYTTALDKLTIEWDTYDHHSGIHSVQWRLFSNHTEEIVHGMGQESSQNNAQCQKDDKDSTRNDGCYCTPFDGCFLQHYHVKPSVTNAADAGLEQGKRIAVHNVFYFIDVVVTNKAQLRSTSTIKITVDVSPPSGGSVFEGVAGGLEIDYQQNKRIHVHWKDFFDRETGILFYRYGYGAECLSDDQFNIEENNELTETILDYAWFDVHREGTFYVTVAAYNRALIPSKPVCSDGVTVDSSVHGVKEVIVKGARIRPSLVLLSDASVWYINTDRTIQLVENPPEACRGAAWNISEDQFIMYPRRIGSANSDYIELCTDTTMVNAELLSAITSTKHMEIHWKVDSDRSKIHDFSVALSSSPSGIPALTDLESSNSHQHFLFQNTAIQTGRIFHIIVKTISKTGKINIQNVGPFLVDDSPPGFQGELFLAYSEDTGGASKLIIKWSHGAFTDDEDSSNVVLELAIGTSVYSGDIMPYSPVSRGRGCNITDRYVCTTLRASELYKFLHNGKTYYATLKATNARGLSVIVSSNSSIYSVMSAVTGTVVDMDSDAATDKMDDIDFQSSTSTMSARWYGFSSTSKSVQHYTACVSEGESIIVGSCINAGTATEAKLVNLQLKQFKRYLFAVTAVTSSGNMTAFSDGIIPINSSKMLDNIRVYGGSPCTHQLGDINNQEMTPQEIKIAEKCGGENMTYQTSVTTTTVYWSLSKEYKNYIQTVNWYIQEKTITNDSWKNVTKPVRTPSVANHTAIVLPLQSGHFYQFVLTFCADRFCFPEVYSNQVVVISKPPVFGAMIVEHVNTSQEIHVAMDEFRDGDIKSDVEARASIDHYEWAFTDNSHSGRIVTNWTVAQLRISEAHGKVRFTIPLRRPMRFTKCWRISVRGFSKTGMYSIVSAEVLPCLDKLNVRRPLVIDAVNTSIHNEGDSDAFRGEPITIVEDTWEEQDKDYTPSPNILSAVWPTLRYPTYYWAVVELQTYDAIYYVEAAVQNIQHLCASGVAIDCGKTDKSYINANLRTGKLINGNRYIVCIHALSTIVTYVNSTEELPELTVCSDGVTVDTSSPVAGKVWIAGKGDTFQSSTSELMVFWETFADVEKFHHSAHASGISNYEIAIGSKPGGTEDVFPFTDVGVTNQYTFHGLLLQNGKQYYASVAGVDFTGRRTLSVSPPIVIDSTAPTTHDVPVQFQSSNATDGIKYTVCWPELFQDVESGMSFYIWSIGLVPGGDDIYPYSKTSQDCGRISVTQTAKFSESNLYMVSITGYNRVGLSTRTVITTDLEDRTSPNIGRVMDGVRGQDREVNYMTENIRIDAYWTDYHDEESMIKYYTVTVGTKKQSFNDLQTFTVDLAEEIHLNHLRLIEGATYFITVTACNMVDLCSSATSDGVTIDSTAPVPGTVTDGYQTSDMEYQHSRFIIEARWSGFVDNQSQISHYTWRVGTAPGDDDIVPSRPVHGDTVGIVADMDAAYGRTLPVKTRLFSTVRAYNMAGMWSEAISNGVIIDNTAPVILSPLRHELLGSLVTSTACVRSSLKFKWDVEDKESHIQHQYLSIVSHLGEDFNISLKIPGIYREFTFIDLSLQDGSEYDVFLTVCNGANTCMKSVIEDILVDSTPPSAGSFYVDNIYAVDTARRPDSWMVWSPNSLRLAWFGFSDEHSGITKYMLNVGSQYMTADLNQIPGVTLNIDHDATDEGNIQAYTVSTQNLTVHESIFVSLWAQNGVGLQSDIILSQFRLNAGGHLEFVRTCPASCLGYCVCTAKGTRCPTLGPSPPCVNVTGDKAYAVVNVSDKVHSGDNFNNTDVTFTYLRDLVSATWVAQGENVTYPKWYDWGIGLTQYSAPIAVFGAAGMIWHDAGTSTSVHIPLDNEHVLEDGKRYSVFIRAWYDDTKFADYKSPGILAKFNHPVLGNRQGASAVKEITEKAPSDVDYVGRTSDVYVDWSDVLDGATTDDIRTHWIYLSTTPGGDDMRVNDNALYGHTSRVYIPSNILAKLAPGVRYFSNVHATNEAGLQTVIVSDGFTVDTDAPQEGHVMDGVDNADIQYQKDSFTVFANWKAFTDAGSGLRSYHWCVSRAHHPGSCDIVPVTNVSLEISAITVLGTALKDGEKIISEVYARDNVGLASPVALSGGVTIDTTPPIRHAFGSLGRNLVQDPSFDRPISFVALDSFIIPKTCDDQSNVAQFSGWMRSNCAVVIKTDTRSQRAFLWIRGSLSQTIRGLQTGYLYKVSVFLSVLSAPISHRKYTFGMVRIAGINNIFKLLSKTEKNTTNVEPVWQLYTYFFKATNDTEQLVIETLEDPHGMLVNYVSIQELPTIRSTAIDNVHVLTTNFGEEGVFLQAVWMFEDEESGIKEYMWAIGTERDGTQLQEFQTVDGSRCSAAATIKVSDLSNVVVTVVAKNGADLLITGYSEDSPEPVASTSENYAAIYGVTSGMTVLVLVGAAVTAVFIRKRHQASKKIQGASKENRSGHTEKTPTFVKLITALTGGSAWYSGLEHPETQEERYERLKRESKLSVVTVARDNRTYEGLHDAETQEERYARLKRESELSVISHDRAYEVVEYRGWRRENIRMSNMQSGSKGVIMHVNPIQEEGPDNSDSDGEICRGSTATYLSIEGDEMNLDQEELNDSDSSGEIYRGSITSYASSEDGEGADEIDQEDDTTTRIDDVPTKSDSGSAGIDIPVSVHNNEQELTNHACEDEVSRKSDSAFASNSVEHVQGHIDQVSEEDSVDKVNVQNGSEETKNTDTTDYDDEPPYQNLRILAF